ncbi:MAG: carbohydrate kinase family protein [Pseudomonadota bacterium]
MSKLATQSAPALGAVVVGSAVIDVITVIAEDNIERVTRRDGGAPVLQIEQGRKLPAESIESHVGGGGANVSTSLSRLGWRAAAMCKLGDDLNAEAVRAHLAREAVSHELLLQSETAATGVSVMISAYDRNAAIFVHRGANELLTAEEVAAAQFGAPALVYVAPLSSGSADCFGALLLKAKAANAFTAANLGIRHLTSRTRDVLEAMGQLDLLSLNAVEAAALAPALIARGAPEQRKGRRVVPPECELMRRGLRSGGCDLSLSDFFEAIHRLGPKWCLVTDGAAGAYLSGAGGVLFCGPARAEVAGTAGAGDAYCSALTAMLVVGSSAEQAMISASLNAASVVSHVNTTDGLMTASELQDALGKTDLSPIQVG